MKTSINDGGPAFPRPVSHSDEGGTHFGFTGMTLRDYFAGQALAGICAPLYDDESPTIWKHREFAKGAYMFADAMLAARKEGSK
jgi:hypothetical protein